MLPLVTQRRARVRRLLIGAPLPSSAHEGQLLRKRMALPIFASDPLSSVAYAPQELLLILAAGGTALVAFTPLVATAVVTLLIVVVVSTRQLVRAYPSGGGDYEVAARNLGERAGLVVASALLIDYVLTVAVSVASGVDNIISALPGLHEWRVEIALACVAALVAINLRGVAEASKVFAIPTYLFIGSVLVMIVVGGVRDLTGSLPVAESARYAEHGAQLSQAAMVLVLLRAFASGCSALTGVEAIANGVQAFRRPKVRNAQLTLVAMGSVAITLFVGVTYLMLRTHVHYVADPCSLSGITSCDTYVQRSVIAQVASATLGGDRSVGFYVVQATTALVLLLAANTAFNGFPLLGAVLGRARYAPKAMLARGDRLVFSNGVLILGTAAGLLLLATDASLTVLIQLYIIGVFVSFTLGQTGMVVHWTRRAELLSRHGRATRGVHARRVVNVIGAAATSVVLVIVTVTKFTHGAWLVFLLMPVLWFLMLKVNRYYAAVEVQIAPDGSTRFGSSGDHAIVLVHTLHKPALKAIDYALAAEHASLEAVHVATSRSGARALRAQWEEMGMAVPLTILESPYRDVSTPLIEHIKSHRDEHGSEVVSVYAPHYVYGHWWEGLLHNRKLGRIEKRLALCPGVAVVLVPWLLDSTQALFERQPRPLVGLERRGVSGLPPVRRNSP
ncbi:APC family permease [Demequina capsici]|uniref:APC family permease n=1 Tax=Demequina capsici TaxID=3075620 RepID=A0AA96F5R7_9MICO|nr:MULTISPECIES: APC family permease [unclassified Demequina]WNM23663.1 APC family permease [Demequina sp. OYTSA14]WNM26502.1 APC family permease [Demequina sp. PMTSA13]